MLTAGTYTAKLLLLKQQRWNENGPGICKYPTGEYRSS
jgi:hypothetical protein